MEEMCVGVTDVLLEDMRRKHVAVLLSEQGSWRSAHSVAPRAQRRNFKRSKSVLDLLLFPKVRKDYFLLVL